MIKFKDELSQTQLHALLRELEENRNFDSEIPKLISELNNFSSLDISKKEEVLRRVRFILSTLRNRLLITKGEQELLRSKIVCFFGLSVGSHAVNSWMMESRAESVIISDPDVISQTNMNRLNSGWADLGVLKTKVVAKNILKINPYCRIYTNNSNSIKTIGDTIINNGKVDLIVEQVDDLVAKIELRKVAKERKLPLIMATDVGDNVFIDVERYDLDNSLHFFNGRVESIGELDVANLSVAQKIELAIKIAGKAHNSRRMLQSLAAIGSEIRTWPQLGTTALIAGSLIAKTVRKIFLGELTKSGRYVFDFDDLLTTTS